MQAKGKYVAYRITQIVQDVVSKNERHFLLISFEGLSELHLMSFSLKFFMVTAVHKNWIKVHYGYWHLRLKNKTES